MFGLPLHPVIVHFPIVLSILLPISVLIALWSIRKGSMTRRTWYVPIAFAATLALSAFVATQTGENEEDAVKKVVPKGAVHTHEEAAERFLVLSGILVVVAVGGLLPGTLGQAARLTTAAGALGLVAAGVQVGHSGGTLVYVDGAASAYTTSASPASSVTAVPSDTQFRSR